nr:SDR family oxidoreductase [Pseudonocardia sp. H11422]
MEISALVVDLDADELRRMLEVNVVGTALGCKHGLRAMRPGGAAGTGGAIVNISSVAATIAFPGIAGYSAIKSAVDRLTRVAAQESGKLGYGVRVNCVYPGLVPTEMGTKLAADMAELGLFPSPEAAAGAVVDLTPAGRLGEVADMADAWPQRRCSPSRSSRCRPSGRRPPSPTSRRRCRPGCRRGRTRGSTPRSTRCTPRGRSSWRSPTSASSSRWCSGTASRIRSCRRR